MVKPLANHNLGRYPALALATAALLVLSGCGSDGLPNMVPIRGEVTYNGKPLNHGRVVYLPKDPTKCRQASGPIKADGTFELTTQKGGDGAMFGDYEIVVFSRGSDNGSQAKTREEYEAAMKNSATESIPERFMDPSTSGVTDKVDGEHTGFKKIELTD